MPRILPAALFILAIIYFKPVDNIKCYVCRSDLTDGCRGEPLNRSYVQECPKRPSASGAYCRKILQQLYFKDEKDVTVIRECAYEKNPKQCYKSGWINAAYQETCECDSDMCNKTYHSVGLLSLIMVMLLSLPLLSF